jgi:hypothetical protein
VSPKVSGGAVGGFDFQATDYLVGAGHRWFWQ